MIHVHLADRGTTTFTGDFRKAYELAKAYIRDNSGPDPEKIDDDRPEGVSEKDWRFYCTPSKARITGVIQSADRPMLSKEISDASKVCRTSACRILNTMALLGEVRNVGVKAKAKWVRV